MFSSSGLFRVVVLAGAYVAGGLLGLSLAAHDRSLTTLWPPSGIALAAVIVFGPRMWPGIAAGSLTVTIINGVPIDTALLVAVGNTAGPLLAGVLMRRHGFRIEMDRLKDVASLVFIGAIGGMLVTSVLGIVSVGVTGFVEPDRLTTALAGWFVTTAMGVILITPFLLSLRPQRDPLREHPREAVALFVCTIVVAAVVLRSEMPIRYIIFPVIMWAAMRFHQRGATAQMLLLSTVSIYQGIHGNGPFQELSMMASLVAVQGLNAVVAIVSLTLAAVTTERLHAQDELRAAAAQLEARVDERTAELQMSERRMHQAQALAHIGSFHWDMWADRVTWTEELYRIFGVTPEEFPATFEGYLERVHPDEREAIRASIEQSVVTGTPFEHDYRIVQPDGTVLTVHGRAEPIFDRAGRVLGLQGYCHDITERKNAEDALRTAFENEREATQRLREIDEMKDALLAAVSHELRTPLTVILGVADTMLRPDIDAVAGRDLLQRLSFNAKRLDRLLKDLLDLDRLNRSVIEPRTRPTDIRDLVDRVLCELEIRTHPVIVELTHVALEVDGAHVERIVENLLVNATKHTPEGTPVWVRSELLGDGLVVIVEDDGPGVSEHLRSVIFEPFRQGNTRPHQPGTGIGLSLVARFARVNGGRAWMEDREGGGASFRVLLPMSTGVQESGAA